MGVCSLSWLLNRTNIFSGNIIPRMGIILRLLAFVMVWLYYDRVAVPEREAWKFQMNVTRPDSLLSPAFTVTIGSADAAFAQFHRSPNNTLPTKCFWPEYNISCPNSIPNDMKSFNSSVYGELWYLTYQPNSISEQYSNLSQRHIFQVFTSCKADLSLGSTKFLTSPKGILLQLNCITTHKLRNFPITIILFLTQS